MNPPERTPAGKETGQTDGRGREISPDPLAVAALGFAIFPLPRNAKVPTLTNWPDRCISDPETIRRCWLPGSNIGIGCKANQVLGVDLDRHHSEADGIETFSRLLQAHGQPWPETFTVRTPSGGLHLYFRAPRERALGNTQGKLGPGIDTRGPGRGNAGGYLVAPGSLIDGTPYTIARELPMAELPGWLTELLDPPTPPPSARPATLPAIGDRYAARALQGEIDRLLAAPGGERNAELNRAAFVLGTLVGGQLLDRGVAETALREAAVAIGLEADPNCGPRQINKTIESGLNAGCARPRIITRRAG